jgi:hypothetical protein
LKKKSTSSNRPFLSLQKIVVFAAGWGLVSLLIFLLFSIPLPGESLPGWYVTTTYILELGAFLLATLLCFRNWRSTQIVSGRNVWFFLGAGMLSYFIGNILLFYWEIVLRQSPEVSPGDLFFLLTYLFLGIGMFLAVASRRLSLTVGQYAIIAVIALIGVAVAYYTAIAVPEQFDLEQPEAIEQLVPPEAAEPSENGALAEVTGDPAIAPEISAPATPEEDTPAAPAWALSIENLLSPFADFIGLLYILGDLVLLVMATALLLAFWGGRFSLSWRFIAAAAFCFYIADLWFNFATTFIEDYETGALPEVFWIFSGVLVSIGAALEYDLSTQSRRVSRRRT